MNMDQIKYIRKTLEESGLPQGVKDDLAVQFMDDMEEYSYATACENLHSAIADEKRKDGAK